MCGHSLFFMSSIVGWLKNADIIHKHLSQFSDADPNVVASNCECCSGSYVGLPSALYDVWSIGESFNVEFVSHHVFSLVDAAQLYSEFLLPSNILVQGFGMGSRDTFWEETKKFKICFWIEE